MSRGSRVASVVLLVGFLLPVAAWAQGSSGIAGIVRDTSGATAVNAEPINRITTINPRCFVSKSDAVAPVGVPYALRTSIVSIL